MSIVVEAKTLSPPVVLRAVDVYKCVVIALVTYVALATQTREVNTGRPKEEIIPDSEHFPFGTAETTRIPLP